VSVGEARAAAAARRRAFLSTEPEHPAAAAAAAPAAAAVRPSVRPSTCPHRANRRPTDRLDITASSELEGSKPVVFAADGDFQRSVGPSTSWVSTG